MSKIVVKIYTAPWCTKCKEKDFVTLLKTVEDNNSSYKFIKINDDEDFPEDITKVPAIQIFKNSKLLHHYVGVETISTCYEMDLESL